jgi:Carbamoyltransferase N-terminus
MEGRTCAAAIVGGGRIVAAAQEERFTRKKNDTGFPRQAIQYCLNEAEIGFGAVDYVVFYDKPFLKFERLLETYLAFAPHGLSSFRIALPIWIKEKLFQKRLLRQELKRFAGNYDCDNRLLFRTEIVVPFRLAEGRGRLSQSGWMPHLNSTSVWRLRTRGEQTGRQAIRCPALGRPLHCQSRTPCPGAFAVPGLDWLQPSCRRAAEECRQLRGKRYPLLEPANDDVRTGSGRQAIGFERLCSEICPWRRGLI